jgi:hypothetical protein
VHSFVVNYDPPRFIFNYGRYSNSYGQLYGVFSLLKDADGSALRRVDLLIKQTRDTDPYFSAKLSHLRASTLLDQGNFGPVEHELLAANKILESLNTSVAPIDRLEVAVDMSAVKLAAGETSPLLNVELLNHLLENRDQHLFALANYYRLRALQEFETGHDRLFLIFTDEAKHYEAKVEGDDPRAACGVSAAIADMERACSSFTTTFVPIPHTH